MGHHDNLRCPGSRRQRWRTRARPYFHHARPPQTPLGRECKPPQRQSARPRVNSQEREVPPPAPEIRPAVAGTCGQLSRTQNHASLCTPPRSPPRSEKVRVRRASTDSSRPPRCSCAEMCAAAAAETSSSSGFMPRSFSRRWWHGKERFAQAQAKSAAHSQPRGRARRAAFTLLHDGEQPQRRRHS